MKTKLIIVFILMATCFSKVDAQQRHHFDVAKFKKERADFLIKEVGMTPDESRMMIPLSNELMTKKYRLNKPLRVKMRALRETQNASDADYTYIVDETIKVKVAEAELDKSYYQKFKKILSPQKLYKYQKAEIHFMQKTVNESQKETPMR